MILRLLAIDETLQVNYTDTNNGTILRASLDGDCLNVTGRPTNKLALAQLFSAILKKTAKHHLEPQIRLLSEQHNLTFKRLVIRGQKTLWGSYSSSGTLSLNYKLLVSAGRTRTLCPTARIDTHKTLESFPGILATACAAGTRCAPSRC